MNAASTAAAGTVLAQLYGALRILVPAGISAAAAAGWLQAGDASALSAAVPAAASTVLTLGAVIWSIYVHSKAAVIASVAAMPEVKAVVTTPEVADGPTFAANPKVLTPTQVMGL